MKLVTNDNVSKEINRDEVEAVKAELRSAHVMQAKGKGKYKTAAVRGLSSHEGYVGLVEYAREIHDKHGNWSDARDDIGALNNAIERVCKDKGEDTPILTINRKTAKWIAENDHLESTDCGDKFTVLMVRPERAKAEKPQVDKDLQVAFNEYVKAVHSGEAVQLFSEALDAAKAAFEEYHAEQHKQQVKAA